MERGILKMRKLTQVTIILLMILPLLGSSQPSFEGILLKDYPSATFLKEELQLASDEILNEIIILPEEEFNEIEAVAVIQNIRRLPPSLLNKIYQKKIYIKLFVGNLTDHPTTSHLKGMIPRGYERNTRWDDIPGIGGGRMVLVKIGHSHFGMGHGSINLELHELAHSIDRLVYHQLRTDPIFQRIWSEEKYQLFSGRTYLLSLPEEYFAECFALFYLNKESNAFLKKHAPKTYEYIKNLK